LEPTADKSEGNDAAKLEEEDFFAQCDNENANALLENNNISLASTNVKVMYRPIYLNAFAVGFKVDAYFFCMCFRQFQLINI